jgi:hypothetical protein
MSFEFLKNDSQLLETGLQTPLFFKKISFYKNLMDPNKTYISLLWACWVLHAEAHFIYLIKTFVHLSPYIFSSLK